MGREQNITHLEHLHALPFSSAKVLYHLVAAYLSVKSIQWRQPGCETSVRISQVLESIGYSETSKGHSTRPNHGWVWKVMAGKHAGNVPEMGGGKQHQIRNPPRKTTTTTTPSLVGICIQGYPLFPAPQPTEPSLNSNPPDCLAWALGRPGCIGSYFTWHWGLPNQDRSGLWPPNQPALGGLRTPAAFKGDVKDHTWAAQRWTPRRPRFPERGHLRPPVQLDIEEADSFTEPSRGLTVQPTGKLNTHEGELKVHQGHKNLAIATCHGSSEHFCEVSVKGSHCFRKVFKKKTTKTLCLRDPEGQVLWQSP